MKRLKYSLPRKTLEPRRIYHQYARLQLPAPVDM